MEFRPFPKIARFSRDIIITEKIDGTNAQITITEPMTTVVHSAELFDYPILLEGPGNTFSLMYVGSRNRWLKSGADNFGFYAWAKANAEELSKLGPGSHFGEWWGSGIQRGYNLPKGEKRFSLFNCGRWGEERPSCCHVVPTLYKGPFTTEAINEAMLELQTFGSKASPGFTNPEGIVIYHTQANVCFKKTFEKDNTGKGD
jgi:hypothetical protein